MKQIAVVFDADSGEFLPIHTEKELQAVMKTSLPIVRFDGARYHEYVYNKWLPVSDNLIGRQKDYLTDVITNQVHK